MCLSHTQKYTVKDRMVSAPVTQMHIATNGSSPSPRPSSAKKTLNCVRCFEEHAFNILDEVQPVNLSWLLRFAHHAGPSLHLSGNDTMPNAELEAVPLASWEKMGGGQPRLGLGPALDNSLTTRRSRRDTETEVNLLWPGSSYAAKSILWNPATSLAPPNPRPPTPQ